MDLRYNEQYIIHFNKLETIDESAINAAVDTGIDPLVVIQYDTNNGGKHLQIKMEPFNTDNVDKAVLPFVEKIQHFKKELRSGIKQGYVAPAVVPKDETVLAVTIRDYFNPVDGLSQEFDEFMDGFTNKPITGYESNLQGFFVDHFLDLPYDQLIEFTAGLNGS